MSNYPSRRYEGGTDLHALIEFAQALVAAALPAPSYYHPGDFAWQLYQFDTTDDVRLWLDGPNADDRVVACAIFEPPLTFQFAIHPAIDEPRELAAEVLRWVEGRRVLADTSDEIVLAYRELGNDTLSTWALDSDTARIELLVANGYARGGPAGVRFARSLAGPPPDVALPPGARFRHIEDGDAEARAELHRAAWAVWGESKHSVERYRRLRASPLYDAGLDIVLEHEGQFVSYCVCWLDTANRVGYFEPVGTRASAAGRGYGRAVIREGMRRLREKGMTLAMVGTGEVNAPAQALYASAGLEVIDGEHFYTKSDRAIESAHGP